MSIELIAHPEQESNYSFPDVLLSLKNKLDQSVNQNRFKASNPDLYPPKKAEVYFEIGKELFYSAKIYEAIESFQQALKGKSDFHDARIFLIKAYEKISAIKKAEEHLFLLQNQRNLNLKQQLKVHYYAALLHYRNHEYEKCRNILENVVTDFSEALIKASMLFLFAKVNDKLSDFHTAFMYFKQANQKRLDEAQSSEIQKESQKYLDSVDLAKQWFSKKRVSNWQHLNANRNSTQPVFLVGFPRSGTTLLGQALNAHSKITTIDERPVHNQIDRDFFGTEEHFARLDEWSEPKSRDYQKNFWTKIDEQIPERTGKYLVIFKLPLLIPHLAAIQRIFPGAKIIVALRDPRDVLLSNFMQDYELNRQMYLMLNLKTVYELYHKVMGLYLHFKKVLPLNFIEIRYENLIKNFQDETTRLLRFLGLDWEKSIMQYHIKARKELILTPSYTQVVQPIYGNSIGRWQNYAPYLSEFIPGLKFFIDKFGYRETVLTEENR